MKRLFRPLDRDEAARVRPWRPPALADADTVRSDDVHHAPPGRPPIDPNGRGAAAGPVTVEPHGSLHASPETSMGAGDAEPEPNGEAPTDAVDGDSAVASERSFAAGFDAGALTAREAMADDVAELLRSLADEHERWRREAEHDTVALARALARWTLRRELSDDPEALARLVREAIDAIDTNAGPDVRGAQPLEVALHPLDLATLPALGARIGALTLVEDDALARGDCRIVGTSASVDARVIDWIDAATRATEARGDEDGDRAVEPVSPSA